LHTSPDGACKDLNDNGKDGRYKKISLLNTGEDEEREGEPAVGEDF
jgi:hypothetical protein